MWIYNLYKKNKKDEITIESVLNGDIQLSTLPQVIKWAKDIYTPTYAHYPQILLSKNRKKFAKKKNGRFVYFSQKTKK